MLEGITLGIIQGITEWLPISSEGVLTLVGLKFFGKDLAASVSLAVFLHLGTFLAALIYFRKDILVLFKKDQRGLLRFLVLSTFVTGVVATPLLFWGLGYFGRASVSFVVGLIGLLLIITGLIQFKKSEGVFRQRGEVGGLDALVAGALQGLASLPGLSRSGLTIAGLLFRKFKDDEALRLSFLMSLPAVFGANIALQLIKDQTPDQLSFSSVVALTTAFVVGLATIHYLLKISRKVNFGWFAIGFGILTLISLLFV